MEISKLTKQKITQYLKENKRFDGRKLNEIRDFTIQTGISKNAEGSALVKIGGTEVMVGIKMDVMEPFPDSGNEGVLITTSELLPMASERFESGPPSIESIELARLVDRGLRESGFIDFKKLCIKENEKVWVIFVDIYVMNDDGGLVDASFLGAVAALKEAVFVRYDEKTEKIDNKEKTKKKIPIEKDFPLTFTFFKIGDKIVLDPLRIEEEAAEARVTLGVYKYNNKNVIVSAQKGLEKGFEQEELFKIFDMAEKKYEEQVSKILKIIDDSKK
jgi:exosome complex component RRP42